MDQAIDQLYNVTSKVNTPNKRGKSQVQFDKEKKSKSTDKFLLRSRTKSFSRVQNTEYEEFIKDEIKESFQKKMAIKRSSSNKVQNFLSDQKLIQNNRVFKDAQKKMKSYMKRGLSYNDIMKKFEGDREVSKLGNWRTMIDSIYHSSSFQYKNDCCEVEEDELPSPNDNFMSSLTLSIGTPNSNSDSAKDDRMYDKLANSYINYITRNMNFVISTQRFYE